MTAQQTRVMKLYLKGLVDKAKKVANTGTSAAVSFILYTKQMRDYIRSLVPNIIFVRIDVTLDKMMASNRARRQKMCEGYGMTMQELCESFATPEDLAKLPEGEWNDAKIDTFYKNKFYSGLQPFDESEKAYTHVIDNNDYGKPGIQHLRTIVGITGDFEYDATALENVQQARYANEAGYAEEAEKKE